MEVIAANTQDTPLVPTFGREAFYTEELKVEERENPINIPPLDAKKTAEIARIAMDDGEAGAIEADLRQRLWFIDRIFDIDTAGVPKTERVLPLDNVLRADVPHECPDREALLSNAADRTDGYIRVPTVVSEEAGA